MTQLQSRQNAVSRETGNITVELALALPLLLLLIAGVVDLGMLYWEKQVLTNATREGARAVIRAQGAGVATLSQAQVRQVVRNYLDRFFLKDLSGQNLVLGSGNFSYTWTNTGTGIIITVQLSQIPYRMLFLPHSQALFGGTRQTGDDIFNLRAQTTMAAEWVTAPPP